MAENTSIWEERPLKESYIQYAAQDVCFLYEAFHKMVTITNTRSIWESGQQRQALFCRRMVPVTYICYQKTHVYGGTCDMFDLQ